MKYLAIILFLVLASCQKKEAFVKAERIPSKIDRLKSIGDVENYIHSVDTNCRNFRVATFADRKVDSYRRYEDSISKALAARYKVTDAFYREDFDNNGYTDLMAIGGWYSENGNMNSDNVLVIMNFGSDSVRVNALNGSLRYPLVPEILHDKGEPLLSVHTMERDVSKPTLPFKFDTITKTLRYRYDGFIEDNPNPQPHHIEKIQVSMDPCFGSCPFFEMTINEDKSAWFIAKAYNFSDEWEGKEEGVFSATINDADYNRLIGLLDYLDFPKLRDDYFLTATDLPGATIIITYDGGKKKSIHDYGKAGTFGLRALYQMIEEMRFSQKWKEAKEPEGLRMEPF